MDPQGIATHGTDLYIAEIGGNKITKVDLSASVPVAEDFIIDIVDPFGVVVYEDYLHFSLVGTPSIFKIDLSDPSATVETTVGGLAVHVTDFIIKDGELFFPQVSSIYKIDLSISSPTPVLVASGAGSFGMIDLAFYGSTIYASSVCHEVVLFQ